MVIYLFSIESFNEMLYFATDFSVFIIYLWCVCIFL